MPCQALCIISKLQSYSPEMLNSRKNRRICWPRVSWKFDGWPWKTTGHLFYATSSFMHHLIAICEFKLELQPVKHPIWVKIGDLSSSVTLKFDGWRCKRIWHFCYATSSFLHHFIGIVELKLELQSGNAQIGTTFALNSVTLPFELWPWLFAWTSLSSMVITHDNFAMIQW